MKQKQSLKNHPAATSTKKIPGLHKFSDENYWTLKKKLRQILIKLFDKIETVERLQKSFNETTVILKTKSHKD